MNFDIKKFVEPIKKKVIKLPTDKEILYLRNSKTYEKMVKLISDQRNNNFKGIWKVAVPATIGVTVSVYNYIRLSFSNDEYNSEAELTIANAIADFNIEKEK